MIPEERLRPLVMGGETTAHSHPHTVTLDQLHRMQQLEDVRFVNADFEPTAEIDFVFVDTTLDPVDILLPRANAGQHVTVSRVAGANTLTILAQPGELINGSALVVVTTTFDPHRYKAIKGYGYLEI